MLLNITTKTSWKTFYSFFLSIEIRSIFFKEITCLEWNST